MSPLARLCTGCARLVPAVAHGLCRACEAERTRQRLQTEPWRAVYQSERWRGTRALATRAAGHRCQALTDGVRCDVRSGLDAHHLVPLRVDPSQAYDLDNVVVLCPRHHRLAERSVA